MRELISVETTRQRPTQPVACCTISASAPRPQYDPLCDIAEGDWEALSRPISHPHTGRSTQPPRSKPLRGLNRSIVVLLVSKTHSKTDAKQKRDRGRDSTASSTAIELSTAGGHQVKKPSVHRNMFANGNSISN